MLLQKKFFKLFSYTQCCNAVILFKILIIKYLRNNKNLSFLRKSQDCFKINFSNIL